MPRTGTYTITGAPPPKYIAGSWEREAQGYLESNQQNNPYDPFAMCAVYQYPQCGIKKKGLKMYYDNMLKEENTALHFPSFKNGDCVQKLLASMPEDQALTEWELHTLEDMRWNDNHQCPIKHQSWDIIKRMRAWMRQTAYTEDLVFATQHFFSSHPPPECLYTTMHTANCWWETQVSRDTPGK